MDSYFIALLPPENIREQVKEIKEEIKDKYQSKKALRLPAHITLQAPFKLEEVRLPHLLKVLEEFAATEESFDIELSGFGAFPPRVVFIEVSNPAPVKHLHKALHEVMLQILTGQEDRKYPKFHPHITVATRDLHQNQFRPAWEEFQRRDFSASFTAHSLTVFRHNGKTWDMLRNFSFKS